MSNNNPLVEVLLPVYNAESTIESAIKSILNQKFTDFVLHVILNGCTDRTSLIVNSIKDSRIKINQLSEADFVKSLQYGLEGSTAKYIIRMDADDFSVATRLNKLVQFAENHQNYKVIGSLAGFVTSFGDAAIDLKEYSSGEVTLLNVLDHWHYGKKIVDASTLFHREEAISVGGYDLNYKVGDISLWLKILEKNKGYVLPEILYYYRYGFSSFNNTHSDNLTIKLDYAKKYKYNLLVPIHNKQRDSNKQIISKQRRYFDVTLKTKGFKYVYDLYKEGRFQEIDIYASIILSRFKIPFYSYYYNFIKNSNIKILNTQFKKEFKLIL